MSVDPPCTVNMDADVAVAFVPVVMVNVVNGAVQSILDTDHLVLSSPQCFFAAFCLHGLDVDNGSGHFRPLALLTASDPIDMSSCGFALP